MSEGLWTLLGIAFGSGMAVFGGWLQARRASRDEARRHTLDEARAARRILGSLRRAIAAREDSDYPGDDGGEELSENLPRIANDLDDHVSLLADAKVREALWFVVDGLRYSGSLARYGVRDTEATVAWNLSCYGMKQLGAYIGRYSVKDADPHVERYRKALTDLTEGKDPKPPESESITGSR